MSIESANFSSTSKDGLIKKLGRYEILSELGKGSMGVVYRAIDPLIDRTVAIKTVNLNLSGDEIAGFVDRFSREAKSAGRLNHPNIVTIYDVGRAGDIAYIAMEHLEGRELKEIIASGMILSPERIAGITAQVADALAFAHDNGVVHRDIKPANIMVLRNGAVKIMDFGIAMTTSGNQTQAGTILGSPKYMSPEQVSGIVVDGRSDIFSLGAVLYELLTGRPAFGDDDNCNLASIMFQVVNEMPDPPTTYDHSIPPAFDYIVLKAMAKKPEDRYQSAKDMASDLKKFKKLTIPAQFPAARLPENKSRKNRIATGESTTVVDTNKKILVTGRNWLKKIIGVSAAVIIIIFAALYIYGQWQSTKLANDELAATSPSPPEIKNIINPNNTAKANAGINFTVIPWGEVKIDGKDMGASPPFRSIKLPPGNHKIEITNATFPPYRKTITLKAGENIKIRQKFK